MSTDKAKASGGLIETGRRIFITARDGCIIPFRRPNTTVNVTVTSPDPQAVIDAIKRFQQRNGGLK